MVLNSLPSIITAGRALINAGHDVKVLEARNRVGGRIDTVDIDNSKPNFKNISCL